MAKKKETYVAVRACIADGVAVEGGDVLECRPGVIESMLGVGLAMPEADYQHMLAAGKTDKTPGNGDADPDGGGPPAGDTGKNPPAD